jgi:hypothetical protein
MFSRATLESEQSEDQSNLRGFLVELFVNRGNIILPFDTGKTPFIFNAEITL